MSLESHYTYTPIDLKTDSIRLIRLLKGRNDDPIRCELFETFLHQAEGVPYEALSYAWGDAPISKEIQLCRKKAAVTESLYLALCCLRHLDEDRILWIDALCIDQRSHREKNHQVKQMRLVYANAQNVHIWLGPSTDDINLLMGLMTQLDKRATKRKNCRKNSPEAWNNEWSIFIKKEGAGETKIKTCRRNALRDLLSRPWFRRVWIIQEVFSARSAVISCGLNTIPTRVFVLMPKLMGVEVDPHTQAVLDIMPGYLRQNSWWRDEPDLCSLLKRFGASKANDPRDNVYALIGIASDASVDGVLQPDYGMSLHRVIENTILYLKYRQVPYIPGPEPATKWDIKHLLNQLDQIPSQAFQWAIRQGNEAAAAAVIGRPSFHVNAWHTTRGPPLVFLADKPGYESLFAYLLTRPYVNVNAKDRYGDTALNIVAAGGHLEMAKLLLECHEINVNHNGRLGQTPLGSSIMHRHHIITEMLLSRPDTNVNLRSGHDDLASYTPLYLACEDNKISFVNKLLDRGADLETPCNENGSTALWVACHGGYQSIAKTLVAHGAKVDAADSEGRTPLWMAAISNHAYCVRMLLDEKADYGPGASHENRTVLWKAASMGHSNTVKALTMYFHYKGVVHEVLSQERDTENQTSALWIAARNGHASVAQLLIGFGMDIDSAGHYGQTALWIAARHGHTETVLMLLREGADREVRDVYDGLTARDAAERFWQEGVVDVFRVEEGWEKGRVVSKLAF
ncbi:ankyrin repeat-containing domain protein [Triangularia setosa]|uniref:Ankyrin repeat-containing domain protein n=1 Tax=Triangularia setosa TaxID=2587417 RepID=A0AAN7A7G4_9PEZI|nr:ankyrin repeat-containing domain protein [Podospora setosa]